MLVVVVVVVENNPSRTILNLSFLFCAPVLRQGSDGALNGGMVAGQFPIPGRTFPFDQVIAACPRSPFLVTAACPCSPYFFR